MSGEIKDDIRKVIEVLSEKKQEIIKKHSPELTQYAKEKINRLDIAIEEVKKLLGAKLNNFYEVDCEYTDEDGSGGHKDTKIVKATSKKQALQKYNKFAENSEYYPVTLNAIEVINEQCIADIE